jgi:hypothetical protein
LASPARTSVNAIFTISIQPEPASEAYAYQKAATASSRRRLF